MRASSAAAAQVVRGGDGMDVAGQVQVEIFHRDDLRISAACRAALDAEGRSLRWLADDGDDALAEMRAQRLAQADRGGRLAFTKGVGVMAVTSMYLPFGRFASRSRISSLTLAL